MVHTSHTHNLLVAGQLRGVGPDALREIARRLTTTPDADFASTVIGLPRVSPPPSPLSFCVLGTRRVRACAAFWLLAVMLLSACASNPQVIVSAQEEISSPTKLPTWYTNSPQSPGFLYATGTANAGDRDIAVAAAVNAAQAYLSASFEVLVETSSVSEVGESVGDINSQYDAVDRADFGNRLTRPETVKTEIYSLDTGYRAFVLLRASTEPGSSAEDSVLPAFISGGWVSGAATVAVANITPEEAHRRARDAAREDALSKVGVDVIGSTLRRTSEQSDGIDSEFLQQFANFTQTTTRGRIVEEEILFDRPELVRGQIQHRIRLRAKVVLDAGVPDPGFRLRLELNETTFRSGEEMVLRLSASRDCYITIFNLYGNDRLSVLLPNTQQRSNYLAAEQTLILPPDGAQWSLPVQAPADLGDTGLGAQEGLVAVATRADISFASAGAKVRQGLITNEDALVAINRWLAEISSADRASTVASYRVVGRP
jgi:hypothetical protein